MRMQIYFNDEESAFVKSQEPGYVRRLVQDAMDNEGLNYNGIKVKTNKSLKEDEFVLMEDTLPVTPIDKVIKTPKDVKVSGKGDGLNTCKKCGSQLMYYKAKCKLCP